MFCSNCGKELKKTYNFCPKCGNVVEYEEDSLYEKIKDYVIENNKVSISLIEKEFKISKKEASKIIDELEENGIVSELKGRKREVLVQKEDKTNFTDKIKDAVEDIMDTPDTTSSFDEEDIDNNVFIALLSYVGILAFIPYFIKTDSKFVKFHAKEGLNLLIIEGIYVVLDSLLSMIKVSEVVVDYGSLVGTRMVTPIFISIPMALIGLVLTVLSIIGIINVCKCRAKELPLISKIKIVK